MAAAVPEAKTAYGIEAGKSVQSVSVLDDKLAATGENSTMFQLSWSLIGDSADARPAKIWRSYAAFKELDAELRAEGVVVPMELPNSRGRWLNKLKCSLRDAVELRRCLLENYLKSLIAIPVAASSKALHKFLQAPVADFPDWPESVGPIDLEQHDLPHDSSATEWWYYNTHFTDETGAEYSAFAAFFRVVKHTDRDTGVKSYAHALNWALSDVANKKYTQEIVLDKDSPAIVKKQLDQGLVKDERLKKAYLEILDRGNVPLPDKMFSKGRDAVVAKSHFYLDYESATVSKDSLGRYLLTCTTPDGKTALEAVLTPLAGKGPIRHGLNGVVKGHDGDDMFYYFMPRCSVSGTVTVDGQRRAISSGQGWYDHEFGGKTREGDMPSMQYAWRWAAIQLSNDMEISCAVLLDPRTPEHRLMEIRAVVIDRDGVRSQPEDLIFTGVDNWTSVRTFNSYPLELRCAMPSAGIELKLEAAFADQEFMTLIAKPGFWEGRVNITGTVRGEEVTGLGYVEVNGFQTLSELDEFFKAVGKETRKAVQEVYPDRIDKESAIKLIATPETPWYVDGVDFEVFRKGIVEPVRYISDQGGKSWRSYGALACMDVVGGDSRKYVRWLSMPEFMHVGSLIVDDIEDNSMKRRGADCAHIRYGQAVAINSGTAAYFQGQQMLLVPGLTAKQLNDIYDYYFAALRAGHAGQALDIAGLDDIMDRVVEARDGATAENRILAIHRLKTAVPAASLARMGALVGGGNKAQIDAIGHYYESIGIAFQIMDDVLNLRGLYTGKADKIAGVQLKNLGEDITAGKVTFPVVKAITLISKQEMRAMWETIKSKPAERAVVDAIIAKLEECGAIDACVEQSVRLVEEAYAKLDPVIEDSFSKIMLRAFGWFVTERTK